MVMLLDLDYLLLSADTAEPGVSALLNTGFNLLRDTEPKSIFCFLRGCDCVCLSLLCGSSRGQFTLVTIQLAAGYEAGSKVYTMRVRSNMSAPGVA